MRKTRCTDPTVLYDILHIVYVCVLYDQVGGSESAIQPRGMAAGRTGLVLVPVTQEACAALASSFIATRSHDRSVAQLCRQAGRRDGSRRVKERTS